MISVQLCINCLFYPAQIRDLNELSRKEVDDIIKLCMKQDCISPNDNIRKRYLMLSFFQQLSITFLG